MPELPEVETIAAGVHARVHGARITAVWTSGKPQTFKSPEHEIAAALTGARIESVRRVGKTIVMTVHRNKTSTELLIHLGMTGRLLVSAPELPLAPHTHAVLTLADSGTATKSASSIPAASAASHLHDLRPTSNSATCNLQLPTPAPAASPSPSPSQTSSPSSIRAAPPSRPRCSTSRCSTASATSTPTSRSSAPASAPPARPPASPAPNWPACALALVKVLRHAIRLGGSSVSDYVDAEGSRGLFQLRHKVYRRTGQPCLACATPIRRITLAGRSTHFCPRCQK